MKTMRIGRTLPPTAAPIGIKSILHGITGFISGSQHLKRIKGEVEAYFGVKHVFFVGSGKAALTVILRALKSLNPDKNEVLIPAYTCYSVPSAVVKAGLRVSLCDIDSITFNFDCDLLRKAINERTLCLVPSHLFGIPADMDRITALCQKKGIFLVEDTAQAMGGSYHGMRLGTLGYVGFFSLGRGKNLTCGSGGIIITNSDLIAETIAKEYILLPSSSYTETLIDFVKAMVLDLFVGPSLYWFPVGLPFLKLGETIFYREFPIKKLSGVQAGLLYNWQLRLTESNEARKRSAQWFINVLGLNNHYQAIPYLRLPVMVSNCQSREKVLSLSQKKGLGVTAMYPAPIHEIEELKDQFKGSHYPVAKDVSQRLVTVPTHQLLRQGDRERIAALKLHDHQAESCKADRICSST